MSDSYLGFNPDRFTLWSPSFSGEAKSPTAPAGTNPDQIATTAFVNRADQSSSSTYAIGSGSANAHTATYLPAVATLTDGMVLRFRAANANTGASTFSPNGLPAKPILTPYRSALSGGEITAGSEVWLQYNSTLDSWVALSIGINPATTTSPGILEIATDSEAISGTDAGRAIVPSSLAAVISSLSLGTMSKQSSGSVAITGGSISGIADLAITDGGTGASTAAQALANLGGAPLASPALTGTPTAPTAAVGDASTTIATTAFVNNKIANDRPFEATASNIKMNGTQAVGSLNTVARGDHVHPTDTTRAPLASPAFTGTPTAPTAEVGTNTTQLATTAFTKAQIAADVPTMIAWQPGGGVGTYALAGSPGVSVLLGQTVAGSSLYLCSVSTFNTASPLSGTWRCMGYANGNGTLWMRIA